MAFSTSLMGLMESFRHTQRNSALYLLLNCLSTKPIKPECWPTVLGRLATTNDDALYFLKEQVSTDENWRVQEMLAKAFDEVCKRRGYEMSLSLIEEWINDDNPNVVRAVTEGLRIWTSRPFFKENPSVAIALISKHKAHESKYLRKSVGNALRDISKKHAELIRQEVEQWDLSNPRIMFTYKLAAKLLK